MECLILSPVLLPFALADVGDMMGRYTLFQKGQRKSHDLELSISHHEGKDYCSLGQPHATGISQRGWPPGEYLVRIRLENTASGAIGMFPPSLFWAPYNQRVEDTLTVTIAAEPVQDAGGAQNRQGNDFYSPTPMAVAAP